MENLLSERWEDFTIDEWSDTITVMLELLEDSLQLWSDTPQTRHQHTQDVYTVLHGIVSTVQSRYHLQTDVFRYSSSRDKFDTLYEHIRRLGNPFACHILQHGKYQITHSASWAMSKHYVLTPIILLWLSENGTLDAVLDTMRQNMSQSSHDTIHHSMIEERAFHVLILLTVYAAIIRRPIDDAIPWDWQQVQYAQDMVGIVQDQQLSVLAQRIATQMRNEESVILSDDGDDAW